MWAASPVLNFTSPLHSNVWHVLEQALWCCNNFCWDHQILEHEGIRRKMFCLGPLNDKYVYGHVGILSNFPDLQYKSAVIFSVKMESEAICWRAGLVQRCPPLQSDDVGMCHRASVSCTVKSQLQWCLLYVQTLGWDWGMCSSPAGPPRWDSQYRDEKWPSWNWEQSQRKKRRVL